LLEIRNGHFATIEDLLFGITVALVDDRNEVQVTSVTKASGTVFQVSVAPTDVGKVIGKDGRTARSIRTLLSARGVATKTRYKLEIISRG
jgi:uncharacterized protein